MQTADVNTNCPRKVYGRLDSAHAPRETTIAAADGAWSSCAVFLSLATGYWLPAYHVRLYAKVGNARVCVRDWTLDNALATGATSLYLGQCTVYCEGWELTVDSGATARLPTEIPCEAYLLLWGQNATDETGLAEYRALDLALQDGATAKLQISTEGYLKTTDANPPGYEDDAEDVAAVIEKPLASTTYTQTRTTNLGAAVAAVVKAASGNVKQIIVSNDNAAARYFQIHDKVTAPVATDIPILSVLVPLDSSKEITIPNAGLHCALGIGFAWSTALATYVAGATAGDHSTTLLYT